MCSAGTATWSRRSSSRARPSGCCTPMPRPGIAGSTRSTPRFVALRRGTGGRVRARGAARDAPAHHHELRSAVEWMSTRLGQLPTEAGDLTALGGRAGSGARRRADRRASSRSCACSRAGRPTSRSPARSSSARGRSSTTSRTSCASSAPPAAPMRSRATRAPAGAPRDERDQSARTRSPRCSPARSASSSTGGSRRTAQARELLGLPLTPAPSAGAGAALTDAGVIARCPRS